MAIYGLLGKTLGHSYSEIIHKKLGNHAYCLMQLTPDELRDFFLNKRFTAVNVTIPYKTDALHLCDFVDDEARSIGSVNTVVNKEGVLYGYNTDIFGFSYMLSRAGISLLNQKVLILGTGGTSLTAHAAAKKENAREIITVSRSGSVNYENIYEHKDADVIINTTPIGMYPNNGQSLLELSSFPKLSGVVDVIYNPSKTKLLSDAEALGLKTAGGLSMLVAQAVRADELFFGRIYENRDEIIEKILFFCESMTQNIVLIGMPGSGKSSIGKLLAEKSGRPFIDSDLYLEASFGRKIKDIIPEAGEEAFRRMETEVIRTISKESGHIIAVGGGAVLKPENRVLLKQNSRVIYIKRPLSALETKGRPLSQGGMEKLLSLYEERAPIYEQLSDDVFVNDRRVCDCADAIFKKYIKE